MIRGLIDGIVLAPGAKRGELQVTLRGELGKILEWTGNGAENEKTDTPLIGISWASARAKTKKAPLAEAMETAFAAGDTPVGLSAAMHAAALAWMPPGFAAFDTGRMVDDGETPPPPCRRP